MIKKMLKNIFTIVIIVLIFFVLTDIVKIQDVIQKKLYPKEYEEIVCKYAQEYGVEENLIFAIIKAESNFDEKASSGKGAMGLMQLMYDTAQDLAKKAEIEIDKTSILEPDTNINLGTKYISILIEKYGNVPLALAAYNAGSGNVDNWITNGTINADGSNIENVPYKETNNYIRKILRDYKIYQQIYE